MNHALMVGSWWPREAQDEIFAGGDFRCASVAAPVGRADRTDAGWEINGQVAFASGSPVLDLLHGSGDSARAGRGLTRGPAAPTPVRRAAQRVGDARRLGDMLGLKGSGSHSIRFDATRILSELGVRGQHARHRRRRRAPGSRLHGNPMYSGRAVSIFTLSLAAVTVGAAYNLLDEYERLMRERKTPSPPFIPRVKDRIQRWYGRALTHIATAEAAAHDTAERHMELCRRNVEEGIRTRSATTCVAGIAREAMLMCWRVIDDDLWQTVGASRRARRRANRPRVPRHGGRRRAPQPTVARCLRRHRRARALGEPQRTPGR